MEHSVPQPQLVRPWRTATLVATAIAGLELVLLVVAALMLVGKSVAPHVHAAAARQARTQPPAAAEPAPAPQYRPPRAVVRLSRAQTGVLVLNGNGVQGAAARAASLVKARGYRVKDVGNAPRAGYPHSLVMYRPGFLAEASRFARDLGLGLVEPLDGMRSAQLHGAQLLLIIGASR